MLENDKLEGMELAFDDLNQADGGAGSRKGTTGLECPECHGFVPTSMQQIVIEHRIICPHCGLKWEIDPQKTKDILDALKKIKEGRLKPEK